MPVLLVPILCSMGIMKLELIAPPHVGPPSADHSTVRKKPLILGQQKLLPGFLDLSFFDSVFAVVHERAAWWVSSLLRRTAVSLT